jgi:hypothetical protein
MAAREEFRAPTGVRKSPENELAGHVRCAMGFFTIWLVERLTRSASRRVVSMRTGCCDAVLGLLIGLIRRLIERRSANGSL